MNKLGYFFKNMLPSPPWVGYFWFTVPTFFMIKKATDMLSLILKGSILKF